MKIPDIGKGRRTGFMHIAVITGASSGLGAEFVRRLSKKNNLDEIWMISRRKEQMENLEHSVSSCVRIRILPLDLSENCSIQHYEQLLSEHQPVIHWLINAAGFGKMGTNLEIGRHDLDAMLLVNCKAAMDLTQLSIPYMGKNSHILEICSTAAFMPLGGLGVYAASKAFLLSYSRSLHYELRHKKIFVTAVCPYWIKDTAFIPTAQKTKNPSAIRHFPMASHTHSVVSWALWDSRLRLPVSTPGLLCTFHRLIAKFIPQDLLMLAWAMIRRI